MSSSWLTLDDADDIIHVSRCDFTNVADKLQEDLDVENKEMDTCTLMVCNTSDFQKLATTRDCCKCHFGRI